MTANSNTELKALSLLVREHVVRMSGNGGCFIGASLSAVDIIVYLYKKFLRIRSPDDTNRDYFLLSKGHDVPALYGLFAEIGYIEKARLKNHLSPNDSIYWHPNRAIPGVEFHSGSLGHLLPVAVGIAMDMKLRNSSARVVVMTGDGELDEGSNWEAMLVASAYNLDNLVVVVDRNEFQANMRTEELIPLEPLADKFTAFGGITRQTDGHDFTALDQAFGAIPYSVGKPSVVIARTLRGKGLPSIEARADRWFCNFNDEEIDQLLHELRGDTGTKLTSDKLVVR